MDIIASCLTLDLCVVCLNNSAMNIIKSRMENVCSVGIYALEVGIYHCDRVCKRLFYSNENEINNITKPNELQLFIGFSLSEANAAQPESNWL